MKVWHIFPSTHALAISMYNSVVLNSVKFISKMFPDTETGKLAITHDHPWNEEFGPIGINVFQSCEMRVLDKDTVVETCPVLNVMVGQLEGSASNTYAVAIGFSKLDIHVNILIGCDANDNFTYDSSINVMKPSEDGKSGIHYGDANDLSEDQKKFVNIIAQLFGEFMNDVYMKRIVVREHNNSEGKDDKDV